MIRYLNIQTYACYQLTFVLIVFKYLQSYLIFRITKVIISNTLWEVTS